jgi:nucleotide-binding universal stress UspA family protein
MPPSAARVAGPARVIGRGRRRKWDEQPTDPASVLIASTGEPIPPAAVSRAVALSGGQTVAVVTIARIYGYAMGLPNPGLMPTQKEMGAQREQVARAIAAIERAGAAGSGQVAATRRPGRTIARVAAARGVRHVVLVTAPLPRWRRIIEGSLTREVRRRLSADTTIETVVPEPSP